MTKITVHPTERELEILQVLWKKGSATVREVFEVLKEKRNTGYTTSLKTMQIMTEKGLLERDTSGRSHVYTPLFSHKKAQKYFINKMLNILFGDSASQMIIGILVNYKLSRKERKEINKYLKKNKKV